MACTLTLRLYCFQPSDATYQTKKVTIIHSQKLLLSDAYPEKWRRDVERRVRERGVRLVLGDAVQGDFANYTENSITTRNGTVLTPDLIVSYIMYQCCAILFNSISH